MIHFYKRYELQKDSMSPKRKRTRSLSSPGSSLTSWEKVEKSMEDLADAKAEHAQELAAKEEEREEERREKQAAVNAKKKLETDCKQMQAAVNDLSNQLGDAKAKHKKELAAKELNRR